MKKILSALIFLLTVLMIIPCMTLTSFASVTGLPDPPVLEGIEAYYFYNITEDKLIASENALLELSTSTSAKVMSGLLLCEMLEGRLDEHIQITEDMLKNSDGVEYGYQVGETVLIKDLLYAAICGSYNDAMYIAAFAAKGSAEGFVNEMNKKAALLGATQTHYENPLGYPEDKDMLTTASDVGKIALYAQKNKLYMEISSAFKHETGEGDIFYNRNYLVCSHSSSQYFDKYFLGMNAGSSRSDGNWSVVTVADDGTQRYLCVILGGGESPEGKIYAYSAANKLANWAFAEYNTETLFKKGTYVGNIEIGLTGTSKNSASYVTSTDLTIYVPRNVSYDRSQLTSKIELDSDKVNAPVEAGHKVGVLKIYLGGDCVGRCDLVLEESYEPNPILLFINKVSEYTKSRAFIISLITLAVLLPIVIIAIKIKSRRTKRIYRK